jgi:hypothetical protein
LIPLSSFSHAPFQARAFWLSRALPRLFLPANFFFCLLTFHRIAYLSICRDDETHLQNVDDGDVKKVQSVLGE